MLQDITNGGACLVVVSLVDRFTLTLALCLHMQSWQLEISLEGNLISSILWRQKHAPLSIYWTFTKQQKLCFVLYNFVFISYYFHYFVMFCNREEYK